MHPFFEGVNYCMHAMHSLDSLVHAGLRDFAYKQDTVLNYRAGALGMPWGRFLHHRLGFGLGLGHVRWLGHGLVLALGWG